MFLVNFTVKQYVIMRITKVIAILFALSSIFGANAQQKIYVVRTVAFYNFENLFDTINNPNNDEEWLPDGLW